MMSVSAAGYERVKSRLREAAQARVAVRASKVRHYEGCERAGRGLQYGRACRRVRFGRGSGQGTMSPESRCAKVQPDKVVSAGPRTPII